MRRHAYGTPDQSCADWKRINFFQRESLSDNAPSLIAKGLVGFLDMELNAECFPRLPLDLDRKAAYRNGQANRASKMDGRNALAFPRRIVQKRGGRGQPIIRMEPNLLNII